MKKLSDFHYNPENPRIIRDKPYSELKKSLEKAPWMMKLRPIVVDETGMILAGDKRHRILVELKHKEVPDEWILAAEDLTPEQKQEFIIKDNLHAGEWDWNILNQNWDADQLKEWQLQVPEWDLSAGGGEGDDEEKAGAGTRTASASPGDGFSIFEIILQADQKQRWDAVLATLQNRLALEKQSDAFMVVLDTFLQHHALGEAFLITSEGYTPADDAADLEEEDEDDDQIEEEADDSDVITEPQDDDLAETSQHVKAAPRRRGRPSKIKEPV